MPTGRPRGTHQLKRDPAGISVLDRELARRGLPLVSLYLSVPKQTLQYLRVHQGRTTLATAYRVARAIDADQADALVEQLFEPSAARA